MRVTIIAAVCVASLSLVIAAFAFSGRYHVTTIRAGAASYVLMVDRFTGNAYRCVAEDCRRVPRAAPLFGEEDEIVIPGSAKR